MAGLKIDEETYLWTIDHILKYGDTDIFPYPLEFEFLNDSKETVAKKLASVDLTSRHPTSLVETLHPKSRYGFRTAHQLFPIDTIIFLASTISIAQDIEDNRTAKTTGYQLNSAFSYRYQKDDENFSIFSENHKYKNWLDCLTVVSAFSDQYTHVIVTDISDFYQRIYRHRLENCLNSYTAGSPHVKFLERCMNDWRSRQSFGIPVGNNASRLLAEAALCDTDQALLAEGYDFTRYVDDIVIFLRKGQDPYTALAFLAGHLMANEGLALNTQKTRIFTREEYMQKLPSKSGEDIEQAEKSGIDLLFWAAYGEEEIDKDALADLKARDLLSELSEEVAKDHWDVGRIRILLRAIRLTKSRQASQFLKDNFATLIPFVKDVVLVIEELKKDGDATFDGMSKVVVDLLLSDTLRSLKSTRAWLFELFFRKILPIDRTQIRKLGALTDTLDKRYLNLLRSRSGDVNYFRTGKTKINELTPWEQPSFIWGARCLPGEEYVHWVRSIKSRVNFELGAEFCEWCIKAQKKPI